MNILQVGKTNLIIFLGEKMLRNNIEIIKEQFLKENRLKFFCKKDTYENSHVIVINKNKEIEERIEDKKYNKLIKKSDMKILAISDINHNYKYDTCDYCVEGGDFNKNGKRKCNIRQNAINCAYEEIVDYNISGYYDNLLNGVKNGEVWKIHYN